MIQKAIFALAVLFGSQLALAQEAEYQEGKHYFELNQTLSPSDGDSVEVTEYFSYLCSHCNTLESYVESWAQTKPDNVTLNRVQVDFGGPTTLLARSYIAAEMSGIADESHPVLMDAIWKEGKRFRNEEQLADFYANFGLEQSIFLDLIGPNNFALSMTLRRNAQDLKQFGVTGTPVFVVNRKYRVPNTASVMDVIDYLIERETANK